MGQTLLKLRNRRHSVIVRDLMQNSKGLLPTLNALDRLASPRIVERALKDIGLTRTTVEGPSVLLPMEFHQGLLEAVSEKIGERHLGAIMAKNFDIAASMEDNSFANYVFGASRLDVGIERSSRALPFMQRGTQLHTRRDGQHLVVSFGAPFGDHLGARLIEQEIPMVLIAMVRGFLGPTWQPDWIELPSAHRFERVALSRVFGTEVRIRDTLPGIALPLSRLHAPAQLDQLARLQMTAEGIQGLLMNRPPRTQADTVCQALRVQLNKGSASVDDVAEALGLGVRTLQRQLRMEGVTFKDIAQSEQVHRARMLLGENDLSLSQIAFYLGFTEVNSFRRAFRTWFGQSPTQYRSRTLS